MTHYIINPQNPFRAYGLMSSHGPSYLGPHTAKIKAILIGFPQVMTFVLLSDAKSSFFSFCMFSQSDITIQSVSRKSPQVSWLFWEKSSVFAWVLMYLPSRMHLVIPQARQAGVVVAVDHPFRAERLQKDGKKKIATNALQYISPRQSNTTQDTSFLTV